MADWYFAIRP